MKANGKGASRSPADVCRRVQINGEECMVFVFHDTTQEQRTHTELLAVNTCLAQAGRMARLGAWEDVRGQGLVYWSDVCYDIHGLPPGSALPRRYIETYVAPPWQDAMRANFRQCIAEQTEWSMEIQIIRADGSLRWVRTRGEPVVENGRVVAHPGGDAGH
jgi:PAS domain S-box-containing protein